MKKLFTSTSVFTVFCVLSIAGYSQGLKKSDLEPLVFAGSTDTAYVYSPGLAGNLLGDPSTQPVDVILPPGYDLYPGNRYPVIYFLHGYTEDYHTYTDRTYNNPGFNQRMNYLLEEKLISPVIVVKPNGKNKYDGSFYTNSYVSGNWEDFIVQDVVNHVENKYQILDHWESRGLSGFSMGGYGTVKLAMKHPSVYSAICPIAALLDFEMHKETEKEYFIEAAGLEEWNPGLSYNIKVVCAWSVACAPDTTKPVMGAFPYTANGVFIDSIWDQYLMHDPASMLQTQKDSLAKLKAIQIYIGENDDMFQQSESFHQALLDLGIAHGYEIYSGGHNPVYVLNDLLMFFSDQLAGIVPTVYLPDKQYFIDTDTLWIESDLDGKLFVVPKTAGRTLDSILEFKVHTADVLADEKYEYPLSGLEFGRYMVYAICNDSIVSNIPGEFCVVPDTTLPKLETPSDTIMKGEPISVSSDRNGTVCLLKCGLWCEGFSKPSEILENCIDSMAIEADDTVSFSTESLSPGWYQIYGFDEYGIVSEPAKFQIIATSIDEFGDCPSEIELFPNPVNGTLTLQTNRYGLFDLSISSINGQLLYSSQMEGNSRQIDLSSFQKGVYFITIRSVDFIATRKIIKL